MIPMVFYNVKMDDSTDWHPVYSIEFSLYYLVIILILATYTIFNSVKSYHNLTEEKAKKKWRLFSTGLIGGISTLSIPSLVYYLPPENIIRIYFTFGYFLLIPFVLLIYLGLRNKN
jgi:O-antigen/teichoic acid export membrane protein